MIVQQGPAVQETVNNVQRSTPGSGGHHAFLFVVDKRHCYGRYVHGISPLAGLLRSNLSSDSMVKC
jgi:hypothetical protein